MTSNKKSNELINELENFVNSVEKNNHTDDPCRDLSFSHFQIEKNTAKSLFEKFAGLELQYYYEPFYGLSFEKNIIYLAIFAPNVDLDIQGTFSANNRSMNYLKEIIFENKISNEFFNVKVKIINENNQNIISEFSYGMTLLKFSGNSAELSSNEKPDQSTLDSKVFSLLPNV